MSTDDGLAQVLDGRVTGDFATFLRRRFSVFRVIDGHDSQCISYGVRDGRGGAWFVKHSTTAWANGILERARLVHAAVSHPAIIPLRGAIQTDTGLALVYPWVAGVCLNENGDRSGRDRFRRLPVSAILAALGQVYDAHLAAAAAGLVAVDLYDGCLIYDFDTARLWLCDLDEYRRGPFVLDQPRLPGSSRFMAPEEFQPGSLIDQTTNVFTLGRTAFELLSDGSTKRSAWRGTDPQFAVALRATRPKPAERYPTVAAFVAAWRAGADQ